MLPFTIPYATDRATRRVPYATYGLLLVNLLVFVSMSSLRNAQSLQAAFYHLGFVPSQGHWYSVITSMFVHADIFHLLGNMLFLWLFGVLVEDALGSLVFIVFFVGSQLAANVLHVLIAQELTAGLNTPLIGASGAVAGLLGLVAVRFARTKVRVFYWVVVKAGVFEVSTLVFVGCWLAWNLYQGITWVASEVVAGGVPSSAPVAYWAHIGGFCFGMLGAAALSMRHEGRQEYLLARLKQNPLAVSGYDVTSELETLAGDRSQDPEVHHALARQYLLARRPQVAGETYMKAVGLYLRSGDALEAVNTYTELLTCFPDCVLPLADQFGIACALEQQGKYALALQAFDKLSNSYPDTPEAETSLVRAGQLCVSKLGNPRLAVRLFSSLLEQYPGTEWRQFVEQRIAELGGASGPLS